VNHTWVRLAEGEKEVVWLRLDCFNPSSKAGRIIPLLVIVGKTVGRSGVHGFVVLMNSHSVVLPVTISNSIERNGNLTNLVKVSFHV
jgi:hypothetical protein